MAALLLHRLVRLVRLDLPSPNTLVALFLCNPLQILSTASGAAGAQLETAAVFGLVCAALGGQALATGAACAVAAYLSPHTITLLVRLQGDLYSLLQQTMCCVQPATLLLLTDDGPSGKTNQTNHRSLQHALQHAWQRRGRIWACLGAAAATVLLLMHTSHVCLLPHKGARWKSHGGMIWSIVLGLR